MESTNDVSAQLNKPVLKEGSTGDAVKELQELLKKYDTYAGAIDGLFGPLTKKGVIAFQHRVFLEEDGIVDDNAWRALFKGAPVDMPILKKGSKGDLVIIVQNILKSTKDYNGAIDGEFASKLERAVKHLQKRTELPDDGIVEDRTWFELSKIAH
jgi:peptidoglycan hydrolase-like protein with peptidoglycan-binding domain